MDSDTRIKLAIYLYFAETGQRPSVEEIARRTGVESECVLEAYQGLRAKRLLVLEEDGSSIRMASPFSGVATQHIVESDGLRYYANCAWDAFGVLAALHKPGTVHSRCEQSGEPYDLKVSLEGPERSDWLFHCLVPAAKWWEDIIFT